MALWLEDLTTFIFFPFFAFIYLVNKEQVKLKFIGFCLPKTFSGNTLSVTIESVVVCSMIIPIFYFSVLKLSEGIIRYHWPDLYYVVSLPRLGNSWVVFSYEILSAAIYEELFFRSLLFYLFVDRLKSKIFVYVIASSLLFSLCHWEKGLHIVVATLFFGIMASSFYAVYKSLVPLVTAHILTWLLVLAAT